MYCAKSQSTDFFSEFVPAAEGAAPAETTHSQKSVDSEFAHALGH